VNCEEVRDILDDWADGLLASAEAARLEAHLEGCPECSREARELRGLLERAAALPREAAPERDLWSGVRDRIERRSVEAFFAIAWPAWGKVAAVAAGLLVVAAIAGIGYELGQRSARPTVADSGTQAVRGPRVADAAFEQARRELLALLDERRDSFPPDTLKRIRENLRAIDASVSEIRAALDRDPSNADLDRLLVASYRRQVDLLQRVNDWSTRR
jgi:hypothetical protein